jgi:hypothetical protein
MVYGSSNCDVFLNHCDSTAFIHNSVLSTCTYAVRLQNDSNRHGFSFVNNNIYQTTSGYAFIVVGPGVPDVSDFNNLYAPSGYVGYAPPAGNYQTLAEWQAGTGWDVSSISADPSFVSTSSPEDLHIDPPSPVNGAAYPLPDINIDIDYQSRDPYTPDIGADEFTGHPDPISDLVITMSSSIDDSTDVTLTWSPMPGAQQYYIYKSTTNPTSGFVLIGSTAETTYVDTDAIIDESICFYYVTSDNESMATDIIPDIPSLRFNIPIVEIK